MIMGGDSRNVTTETRVRKGTVSRFRTLVKVILIVPLLATGCAPSQDVSSTPKTAASPFMVAGIVEGVTFSVTRPSKKLATLAASPAFTRRR
jgi:uncharacterized lipoprotein YajG